MPSAISTRKGAVKTGIPLSVRIPPQAENTTNKHCFSTFCRSGGASQSPAHMSSASLQHQNSLVGAGGGGGGGVGNAAAVAGPGGHLVHVPSVRSIRGQIVIALYSYQGSEFGDMSFTKGDKMEIIDDT